MLSTLCCHLAEMLDREHKQGGREALRETEAAETETPRGLPLWLNLSLLGEVDGQEEGREGNGIGIIIYCVPPP